jgi:hypothetical protein
MNTLRTTALLAGLIIATPSVFAITPIKTPSPIASTLTTNTPAPRLIGDNMIADTEVSKLLEQTLPNYDSSLLAAKSEADPVARLSLDRLTDLVRDKGLSQRPAEGVSQFEDGNRSFSLRPDSGKLRYVNRDRTWNPSTDLGQRALDPVRATSLAKTLFSQLGLPAEEMQAPLVRTQMLGGAKVGEKALSEKHEQYRLVIVQRQINRLPVFGANAKVAFNHRGDVQRLGLEWPAFKLDPAKKLRPRSEVIEDALGKIMNQDPDSTLKITAKLAYAAEGDNGYFEPVAVLQVNSLPSPYQVLVPLSELADTQD